VTGACSPPIADWREFRRRLFFCGLLLVIFARLFYL
jgi:hypothetical protein